MITRLSGTLVEKRPTDAVIDVSGVGYSVAIPTSTFEALPADGGKTVLLTHLHVREDIMQLYGFASSAERTVFRAMIGVSGVGPKLALAALSSMRPSEIRTHVLAGDAGFLTRIPGVGRKTAERLIIELRDRLAGLDNDPGSTGAPAAAGARADALSALEALGFSRAGAEKALRAAERSHPGEASADVLVRLALRER